MALPNVNSSGDGGKSFGEMLRDSNLLLHEVGSNIVELNAKANVTNSTLGSIENVTKAMYASINELKDAFLTDQQRRSGQAREASLEAKPDVAGAPTPSKPEKEKGGGFLDMIMGLGGIAAGALGPVMKFISPLIESLKKVGKLFLKFLGPVMALFDAFEGFLVGFSEEGDIISGIREAIANVVKGFIELPVKLVAMLMKLLGFDEAADELESKAAKVIDTLLDWFRKFFDFATVLFQNPKLVMAAVKETFDEFIHDTIENVKKLFYDMKDMVLDKVADAIESSADLADVVAGFLNDTIENIKKVFFDAKDMMVDMIAKVMRGLASALPSGKISLGSIPEWVPGIGGKEISIDLGNGLTDGLTKAAEALESMKTGYQKQTYGGGAGPAMRGAAEELRASKTGYQKESFEGTGDKQRLGEAFQKRQDTGGKVKAGEGAIAGAMGSPTAAGAPARVEEGKKGTLDEVTKFFVGKGFTPEQAAGIAGNLMQESGLNPNAFNPAGGGQGAHGIAQWRGDRWAGLQEFAKSRNSSPNDLYTQLEYIIQELSGKEKNAMRLLQQAKTAEEAAKVFSSAYERAGAGAHDERRVAYANQALQSYSKGQAPGAVPAGAAPSEVGSQIALAAAAPSGAAASSVIAPTTINNVSQGGGRGGAPSGPSVARDTDPSLIAAMQNIYAAA